MLFNLYITVMWSLIQAWDGRTRVSILEWISRQAKTIFFLITVLKEAWASLPAFADSSVGWARNEAQPTDIFAHPNGGLNRTHLTKLERKKAIYR
ncbi:MAG: hypothetical protein C4527_06460 [Candidatus Omnitrophota bacterium]|nr:MAG: hypothetical protein C4527_06460 [Candidatus Omnitrophota bacterium]